MSDIKAGVVLVTKFVASGSKVYAKYISYIDRPTAVRTSHLNEMVDSYLLRTFTFADYTSSYMTGRDNTSALFSANENQLTDDSRAAIKKAFETAEKNGSLMWQSVLSFDNRFLSEYGIYDAATGTVDADTIRTLTRKCMTSMLRSEKLDATSVWTASIHYNTDNIHVHIATVEPSPTRKLRELRTLIFEPNFIADNGVLDNVNYFTADRPTKITATKGDYNAAHKNLIAALTAHENSYLLPHLGSYITIRGDGAVAMSYVGKLVPLPTYTQLETETAPLGKFALKSIESGKSAVVNEIVNQNVAKQEINNLIRNEISSALNQNLIFADNDLRNRFTQLYEQLPADKRTWHYNANAMTSLRPLIDDFSRDYIAKYQPDKNSRLNALLTDADRVYAEAYGGDGGDYSAQKNRELYALLGNHVLDAARIYSRGNNVAASPRHNITDFQNHSAATPQIDYALQNTLYHLKRSLDNEYEHYLNQLAYQQLDNDFHV